MKIMNEETFFLGKTHITLTNTNSFLPKMINRSVEHEFVKRNDTIFDENFRKLALASQDFYQYENNFTLQKSLISKYIKETSNKELVSETGLNSNTISLLKKEKKELGTLSLNNFEKLYKQAAKK